MTQNNTCEELSTEEGAQELPQMLALIVSASTQLNCCLLLEASQILTDWVWALSSGMACVVQL